MDFFTHTAAVFTLHPYIARFSLLLERDVTLHKLLPRLLLLSSDIAKGSMMTPPDHCDPLDSVNAMLKSNIRQQRLLTQSLRQNGLKKKANDAHEKSDFDKVAYTLSLEGDAFQFMDFLDLSESHSRFMRVPNKRSRLRS